jgi:hypothetical protein
MDHKGFVFDNWRGTDRAHLCMNDGTNLGS